MRQQTGQKLKRTEFVRIQYGDSDRPHDVLGRHMAGEGQIINAYHPDAVGMCVLFDDGAGYEMGRMDNSSIFTVYIQRRDKTAYQLEAWFADGSCYTYRDPYSFKSKITDKDLELFKKGIHYTIYDKLGAHPMTIDGIKGTHFAVWAPKARRVSVVGDFCLWDGRRYPMRRLGPAGIFELFVPELDTGTVYKFEIKTEEGKLLLKTDPYGYGTQLRPGTGSIVTNLKNYHWDDRNYMRKRKRTDISTKPMSIYEVHLPSWRRKGRDDSEMFSYQELAHQLADYVKDMGYTHVELIGIAEHPLDGSWGYQVTGYYAPTSRHGKPEDFMYFVDYMHNKGIGVILDWVPGHFPKDAHGLVKFDGSCLYEHPDPRKGEQPQWNTLVFDYSKKEVKNFLIANALFWLKKYHIDGIRVDAVASMLYLDFGRGEGQWIPNQHGGRENLEAIEFLKHLNSIVKQQGEGGYMIAEESSAWPGITGALNQNGLGFDFKWNMGWMHDFLRYMRQEPNHRGAYHHDLIFSMMYAYDEHFVQVLSHDEVVHGKGSMIRKMPGSDEDKFANLRLAYGFMFVHPGKKLLFMGQEFAQWSEWNESRSLEWHLLNYGSHGRIQHYVRTLLHLYKKYKAFYELDYDRRGFEWISRSNADQSVICFLRKTNDGRKNLLILCNFQKIGYEKYRIGAPCGGQYKLILNSDDKKYGGTGQYKVKKNQMAEWKLCDGMGHSIETALPPLSMLIFEYSEVSQR